MPVLVLFLDGVGLGPEDPATNPFARGATPALRALLGGPLVDRGVVDRPGVLLVPADAALGVPGLPQSATGQAALLTGTNAAALVGRHVTAYPTRALRDLLATHSLFATLRRDGRRVALANTYSPEYFAALEARRLRMAAVTFAAYTAGLRLRGLDDLRAGRSVFHDLTGQRLREWGHDVPPLTPFEAGQRLAAIAGCEEMTFFEFFLTDLAAHGRVASGPDDVVAMVDGLIGGALDAAAPDLTVVVTSDHGNLEDARSTAHTTNPVPVLAAGPGREAFRGVRAITDIAPAVRATLARPVAAEVR
ncbi:MAG: metalloenzyme [Armatimonadota bacterium]|nr:metalloenzyme [Armatimonadota bacterium]MDR7455259.1 metalloenzyme [Armatimonadota bacterium]MDR7456494.1 metalloenzyme [Armatimonadota bacterium]MDR7496239.1 metalloenzyme [Armatimonadota bacterium]